MILRNFFIKIKLRKNKEILEKLIDFAEGKISTREFWVEYLVNPNYTMFLKSFKNEIYSYAYLYDDYELYSKLNIESLKLRIHVYWMVIHLLKRINISFKEYNIEESRFLLIGKILPKWLDFDDYTFIETVLDDAPKNISKRDLIKHCRNILFAKYKYVSKPPFWLQKPEWPVVDGMPLLFVKQDGNPNYLEKSKYDDRINYTFKNEHTNETIIITQFD